MNGAKNRLNGLFQQLLKYQSLSDDGCEFSNTFLTICEYFTPFFINFTTITVKMKPVNF